MLDIEQCCEFLSFSRAYLMRCARLAIVYVLFCSLLFLCTIFEDLSLMCACAPALGLYHGTFISSDLNTSIKKCGISQVTKTNHHESSRFSDSGML